MLKSLFNKTAEINIFQGWGLLVSVTWVGCHKNFDSPIRSPAGMGSHWRGRKNIDEVLSDFFLLHQTNKS